MQGREDKPAASQCNMLLVLALALGSLGWCACSALINTALLAAPFPHERAHAHDTQQPLQPHAPAKHM